MSTDQATIVTDDDISADEVDDAYEAFSWLAFTRQVFSWLFLFAALALLLAVVGIPRMANATPYTILTSSMRPLMPPGSLVVAKETDPTTLKTGDVVTYQLRSGEPEVVTHRIIGMGQDDRGRLTFTTKGDNNPKPDPKPILAEQIRGKVWYAVPYIGYLNQMITGKQHIIAVYVVASLLFAYAGWMIIGGFRDRRRERKAPPNGDLSPDGETESVTEDLEFDAASADDDLIDDVNVTGRHRRQRNDSRRESPVLNVDDDTDVYVPPKAYSRPYTSSPLLSPRDYSWEERHTDRIRL